jgi:hypothetical protein
MAANDRPTAKQLRYLRALAARSGTTFTAPTTRRQASEAIAQLRSRSASMRSERRREQREVADDLATARPHSSVRDEEITGYGSRARWR